MKRKIQPMRQKIQDSMVFVITTTLIISYIFLTGIIYHQTVTTVEEEIHREADYISKAVQISGTEYLNQMDEVQVNTRITWISAGGKVLYDSTEDEHTFENHKNRPEVKKALATGKGQDIRKSDTIGEEMCYYAEKMPDGNSGTCNDWNGVVFVEVADRTADPSDKYTGFGKSSGAGAVSRASAIVGTN